MFEKDDVDFVDELFSLLRLNFKDFDVEKRVELLLVFEDFDLVVVFLLFIKKVV